MRPHVGLGPMRILARGSTSVYPRRRNCRVVTPSETKAAVWIAVRARIGLFFVARQRPSAKKMDFLEGEASMVFSSNFTMPLGGPLTASAEWPRAKPGAWLVSCVLESSPRAAGRDAASD